MAMRFHLDENVDHSIAHGLRLRGIDVTTSTDADLLGASDEQQIAFASDEQRVILTHDPDFLRLHTNGARHAGIVFCHKEARSVGELVRFLCLLHDCLDSDDMSGQVEFA
jgi:predicted nuclease of predicted toxin-antitoxin system